MSGQNPGTASTPTLAAATEKYMAVLKERGPAPKTIQKYQNVLDRLKDLADRRRVTKISGGQSGVGGRLQEPAHRR